MKIAFLISAGRFPSGILQELRAQLPQHQLIHWMRGESSCDQELFSEGHVKTNFLCNLGYGEPSSLFPRLPRLAFTEACSLL